jgi:hypothetical protein
LGIKNVKEVDMIESVFWGHPARAGAPALRRTGAALFRTAPRSDLAGWFLVVLAAARQPGYRWLAAVSLTLAALGFLSAALGLFFGAEWARTVTLGAAGFSVLIYLLFWDGKFQALPDQGGVGILISLGIFVVVWIV